MIHSKYAEANGVRLVKIFLAMKTAAIVSFHLILYVFFENAKVVIAYDLP